MEELFSGKHIAHELKQKNGIIYRPLQISDFQKGFCSVLSELTSCKTDEQKFKEIFDKMYKFNQIEPQYFIIVGENPKNGEIAVAGSIIIEKKFIHNGECVGHIEDIIVSSKYRGKRLGEHLISILKDIANKNCYKVILDCNKENLGFYEKCGFKWKSLGLARYF